jgi:signal transduction histidine kinase/ActR/RegA family two-component response regulator
MADEEPEPMPLRFLSAGGRMGALMRAHDWSRSSLGPPQTWPQALRTVVRIMLNTGHPMYVFWGPELACLYNDAYSESIGPERHPVSLGQPGREVWDEIWPIIGPQIDQVMSGGGPTWHVNALVPITRHGRREDVYWTYSYSPIDDLSAPGGVGGVLVVCSETTAQVLTARRLASERDRLAQLFQQAPIFMAMLQGPDHRIELVNPGFMRLVGDRPVVGRTVAEALPGVVTQGYLDLLDGVFATGEPYAAIGAKYAIDVVPGGPVVERHVDVVLQPLRDADDAVSGVFVVGADVTERSLAEQALQQREAELRDADRRKDEFLAMLAHELRNPLAPIRTGLELIRLAGDTPGAVERIRTTMERQVGHMLRLIDDLLDVSRISTGKIELRRHPTPLGLLVGNAADAHSAAMLSKQIALSVDIPAEPCVLDVDPTRFVQILSNLLHNATKFTDAGGRIDIAARVVTTAPAGGTVVLTVRDSGQGIAPDLLPHIFELFVQGSGSSQPGLGIGLALARQLVEMHGGTLTAHSEGVGRGSEFEIRIPQSTRQVSPDDGAAGDHRLMARRVVIIDDNEDAANTMAMLVDALGGQPRVAYDGVSGFDTVRDHRAEVVLLDIGMHPVDGYETCRRIRRELGSAPTVIAVTGWGQAQDKQKAFDAGFDAHLTKPVDPAALARLLAGDARHRPTA